MGPGIQGNREGLSEHNFYLFDIFDIDEQRYLTPLERMAAVWQLKDAGLASVDCCPVLGNYGLDLFPTMQDILWFADGMSLYHKIREGVVFKRLDGQFSFKVISNQFLLAEK